MATLLIMAVGQTDVQLVVDNQRYKLDGKTCGELHDAINERAWSVADVPNQSGANKIESIKFEGLPQRVVQLCTPKLDAVLSRIGDLASTSALILETIRNHASDPRRAGEFLERRLRDRGVDEVIRAPFLIGNERLEDPSNDVDAVVRRTVVAWLSKAIGKQVEQFNRNDTVFVATTGGLAAANELINELVRLHAVGGPTVTALEVPDGNFAVQDDRAVEEKFHPAAGYRARWHALSLVENGNFLAHGER